MKAKNFCPILFHGENMELPKRKHTRLKEYDYSQKGWYHVIICTDNNKATLSKRITNNVGLGLAPAVKLTPIGKIAENQLLALPHRFSHVKIAKSVIMPTHIHAIIEFSVESAGASPRPTLMDVIKAYKSLTTLLCNKQDHTAGRKIFQKSFYDQIIRNEKAYQEICKYIDENPLKCDLDKYCST